MRRWASAIGVLLLWAVAAGAQTGYVMSLGAGGSAFGIKGAPFSAETVNENTRVLQDGNHINQITHGKVFRDSEGRTRNESSMMIGAEGLQSVTIIDPVQQVFIHLNMQGEKTATVHQMNSVSHAVSAPPQGAKADAKPVSPKASTVERPCPVLPTAEDLGTKVIEGFTVVGTRRTHTIEAGKIGNEKPIVTVTDSWYSEELHEALLSETDDPQSGHHTMKLINIQRAEPDPALFQVPPDFSVKDQ